MALHFHYGEMDNSTESMQDPFKAHVSDQFALTFIIILTDQDMEASDMDSMLKSILKGSFSILLLFLLWW